MHFLAAGHNFKVEKSEEWSHLKEDWKQTRATTFADAGGGGGAWIQRKYASRSKSDTATKSKLNSTEISDASLSPGKHDTARLIFRIWTISFCWWVDESWWNQLNLVAPGLSCHTNTPTCAQNWAINTNATKIQINYKSEIKYRWSVMELIQRCRLRAPQSSVLSSQSTVEQMNTPQLLSNTDKHQHSRTHYHQRPFALN